MCVVFNQDCSQLACGYEDNTIRIWDIANGKEVLVMNRSSQGLKDFDDSSHILSLIYSPDGKIIACGTGGEDCSIKIWDAKSG